jgi:hypothetical protein
MVTEANSKLLILALNKSQCDFSVLAIATEDLKLQLRTLLSSREVIA